MSWLCARCPGRGEVTLGEAAPPRDPVLPVSQVLCDHYWPSEAAPVSYGQVRVHLLSQSSAEEWTMREFKLWHVSKDLGTHRGL